jgi:hypothetical protein
MTNFKIHIIRIIPMSMVDCPEYECKKTFLIVHLSNAYSVQANARSILLDQLT